MASEEYQALSHHDQVDAILLSHLIAERFIDDGGNISAEGGSSMSTLMELVEARSAPTTIPPLCNANVPSDVLSTAHAIYNRFGNNNFVVHSHLNSYAHGIFPFASRSFNHSCVPNAVVKYIITPCHPVRMEVIALRDIARGDELYFTITGSHATAICVPIPGHLTLRPCQLEDPMNSLKSRPTCAASL